MTRLSNWKEESDLFEVVTGKMTDKEALKKVDEKKGIKNKVVINPKLTEAIKKLGGELIEVTEEEQNGGPLDSKKEADKRSEDQKKKQVEQKQKRAQMIKKQVLMKKLIAVRQGSEDIVAHHEPEGEVLDERLGGKGYSRKAAASSVYPGKKGTGDWEDSDRGAGNKAARRAGKKVEKKSPTYRAHVLNKEGYDKSKIPEKLVSKVRVKKGAKVQGKYVKEASAVLDANKKLEKERKTKKDKAELAKLTHIYKGMKKGIYNSYEPEGDLIDEAKVDQGRSDYGKASIRNYRRKGPGHGEPAMFDPENKRGKLIDKRREEHKARRGVKGAKVPAYKVNEDKALELVRANIIKKHGKGAIYDPKNVKKPSEADKAKAAAERKKRQDSDNKAYAARAKKAGFKSTQDYTNVVARYGSEDNYKKGRGLGT